MKKCVEEKGWKLVTVSAQGNCLYLAVAALVNIHIFSPIKNEILKKEK